jgi:hypothetical protein
MCLECRMSGASNTENSGFFSGLGNAFKKATNAVLPGKNANNATRKNMVLPVTAGPRNNSNTFNQTGGMAPVNYRVANMQPSEAVMKWATTAGADMPSKAEMRGVAHGGRRSRRRSGRKTIRRRYRKSKRATGGRRRKTNKRKTHRRRRN